MVFAFMEPTLRIFSNFADKDTSPPDAKKGDAPNKVDSVPIWKLVRRTNQSGQSRVVGGLHLG